MKRVIPVWLGAALVGLALTLLVNFPFGFYTWLDQPIDDIVYGVNFFGYYIIGPSSVLDLSYVMGAFVLNFALLYGVSYLLVGWRRKK